MKLLYTILILLAQLSLSSQNFITSLYFEDSLGNRDTLFYGLAEGATSNMDEQFGEIDIKEEALDEFDVRFFELSTFNTIHNFDISWSCNHEAGDVSVNGNDFIRNYIYEAKYSILNLFECSDNARFMEKFFIPTNAAFPITIKWDRLIYQDSCNANSNISELPFVFNGDPEYLCPEQFNYPFISLNDLDSVVLEQPSFLSFLRADGTLVSPYYIRVPHNINGQILIDTEDVLNADVQIFPNPVQDNLCLETTEQNWDYQILNLQGQEMMQGEYQDYIGVEGLPSGIYFLQLSQENDLYKAIKFVKE